MKINIQKIIDNVVEQYKQDKNVLGIMLFGSAARNKFDEYSDIDIYILLKKKGKYSRESFMKNSIRIDIIFDSLKEAKKHINGDKNNIERITSNMLVYGKILFQRGNGLKKIQRTAKNNSLLKTKYKNSEILMHKYSIEDFCGEVQRDLKNNDYLAFGLDSQLLINNILELFIKLRGEYLRQPNEMMEILRKLDRKFANQLGNFYKENKIKRKKVILSKLVNYMYSQSGGPLPKRWVLKAK